MLDHILISSELEDEWLEGTQRVENPNYIGNYLSETSDHYPVWTRFQYGTPTNTEPESESINMRQDLFYILITLIHLTQAQLLCLKYNSQPMWNYR